MSGFWDALGTVGKAITRAIGRARDWFSATKEWETRVGVDVSPGEVYQQLATIKRQEELAPQMAGLAPDEMIPRSWYAESPIPWKRRFAYVVEVYGRDTAGKYTHKDLALTSSREMTPDEILDEATRLFGREGVSERFLDIYQMGVVGAEYREGEAPWT